MIIKQLSVFVENKKGRLAIITDVLSANGINISALSLADTSDFGVLRLIVDKPEDAQKALAETGVVVKITKVVAVAMDDKPGGVSEALKIISDNDIGVEYMYACVATTGNALMILKADNIENADKILHENGFGDVDPTEIYRI